jgi:hypothetical protein
VPLVSGVESPLMDDLKQRNRWPTRPHLRPLLTQVPIVGFQPRTAREFDSRRLIGGKQALSRVWRRPHAAAPGPPPVQHLAHPARARADELAGPATASSDQETAGGAPLVPIPTPCACGWRASVTRQLGVVFLGGGWSWVGGYPPPGPILSGRCFQVQGPHVQLRQPSRKSGRRACSPV